MTRVLVAVVASTLVACSNSQKVGAGLGVNATTATTGCRLGECASTTTAAAVKSAPPTTASPTTRPAAAVATTTTQAPRSTTTAPAQAAVFVIKIQGDGASGQFQPSQAAVPRGATVRWTNVDNTPRSVEADDGSFKSPELPPGGTFDYVASAPGRIAYHDGTRPYAVAQLQVG